LASCPQWVKLRSKIGLYTKSQQTSNKVKKSSKVFGVGWLKKWSTKNIILLSPKDIMRSLQKKSRASQVRSTAPLIFSFSSLKEFVGGKQKNARV
jgi:hypothetical protein